MRDAHKLITLVLGALFSAEHRRLEKALIAHIDTNNKAWGQTADGFIFEGNIYVPPNLARGKRKNLPLHASLASEVAYFASDRKKIEMDSTAISQLLFKLYEPCGYTGNLLQDIRDATPECIIDIMEEDVRQLERTVPPTRMLNHPRDWKHYEKVLPTIEFYSAARLLY